MIHCSMDFVDVKSFEMIYYIFIISALKIIDAIINYFPKIRI